MAAVIPTIINHLDTDCLSRTFSEPVIHTLRKNPQFGLSPLELRALYPTQRIPPIIRCCMDLLRKSTSSRSSSLRRLCRYMLVDSFVRSLIRSFRSFRAAAMEVEGLFRIPGRQTNIFELKVRFEQGMPSVVGSFVRSFIDSLIH